METGLEHLARMNYLLRDDYSLINGRAQCFNVARNIAKRLFFEDKKPYVFIINGLLNDENKRELLVPLPYGGRVEWGAHFVCSESSFIYEPALSKEPVCIDAYCDEMFGKEVEMDLCITSSKLRKMIN